MYDTRALLAEHGNKRKIDISNQASWFCSPICVLYIYANFHGHATFRF